MDIFKKSILIICGVCIFSCDKDGEVTNPNDDPEVPGNNVESVDPAEGIRIAWDFNTKVLISEENNTGYNGYPRLIQLQDGSLLVGYESNGDVIVKKSNDNGENWSNPITVVEDNEGVNMATPDVIQLDNGSILLMYNPRPTEYAPPSKKFLIKTILSNDGGVTWENDHVVYEGDNDFENGVWEPTALQLPSGEIQLFFSNENLYHNSNEQNISLLRSQDNGITWTEEPEITSFRAASRDGMPSPLYLEDQDIIIYAIEDNGSNNQFKPYIIRNTLSQNWSQTVNGSSENRSYALKEPLEDSEYAGAPYLAQLSTGKILLSYQGTDRRNGNELNNADMKVAIGNKNAKDFDRISIPFLIPEGKSALWNSIAVLDDDTVVALSTTNAFSNSSQVWMIKGYVIPEVMAETTSVEIDGETTEDIWQESFPVFIGHQGSTQLVANVSADEENLYVVSKISDSNISSNSGNPENNDGSVVYLDPLNHSYIAPGAGVFKIMVSATNQVKVYEGENTVWNEIEIPEIETQVSENNEGYIQEISIPWSSIGGEPVSGSRIGFNIELRERGNSTYSEVISATEKDAPHSWISLKL